MQYEAKSAQDKLSHAEEQLQQTKKASEELQKQLQEL